MRFDIHPRQTLPQLSENIYSETVEWNTQATHSAGLYAMLVDAMQPSAQTTHHPDLLVASVGGRRTNPVVARGVPLVYVTVAAPAPYQADTLHGVREMASGIAHQTRRR